MTPPTDDSSAVAAALVASTRPAFAEMAYEDAGAAFAVVPVTVDVAGFRCVAAGRYLAQRDEDGSARYVDLGGEG